MLMNDSQSSLTEDELEKAIRSLKDKVDEMKNDLKGEIEVWFMFIIHFIKIVKYKISLSTGFLFSP